MKLVAPEFGPYMFMGMWLYVSLWRPWEFVNTRGHMFSGAIIEDSHKVSSLSDNIYYIAFWNFDMGFCKATF